MSDMNGIEFLQYLKSIGNSTPVILLCPEDEQQDRSPGSYECHGDPRPATIMGDIRQNLLEMVTVIKQTMLAPEGGTVK